MQMKNKPHLKNNHYTHFSLSFVYDTNKVTDQRKIFFFVYLLSDSLLMNDLGM